MAFTRILPAGISTTGTVFLENVTASGIITATTFDGDFGGTSGIAEVSKTISDNPADVFVYDTSKDSDGGAWRYRTQHTSWYKETLNTATRGSRREFPSVAVIVSDASADKVTIYDGDDPDLPMWMVISAANPRGILGWATSNITSIKVTAVNGIMVAATNDSGTIFKFVEDFVEIMYSSANYNITSGRTIADRNNAAAYNIVSGTAYRVFVIVTYIINDVAMTVLPNAPIDDATGLPVPTIAVATNSGVSVIRDDGTVVDITATGYTPTDNKIDFDYLNNLLYLESGGYPQRQQIPSGDISRSAAGGRDRVYGGTSSYIPSILGASSNIISNSYGFATGSTSGLSILDYDSSQSQEMVAYATKSYNTGYMQGDIKGAFLSDTDTTNISGSELIDNGDFATGDFTNWSANGTTTPTISNGGALLTTGAIDGAIWQSTSGEATSGKWVITWTVTSNNGGFFGIVINADGPNGNGGALVHDNITASGSFYYEGNITAVEFRHRGSSFGVIDNITLRRVEDDRSVNNKGTAVYGTVTKSAVATGAELVAYSGWSGSNYLYQPPNSDMAFGTDDFSYIYWIKTGTAARERIYLSFDNHDGSSRTGSVIHLRYNANGRLTNYFSSDGFSTYDTLNGNRAINDNNWHCVVSGRRGDRWVLYIDGELDLSIPVANAAATMTNSTAYTMIGKVGSASLYEFVEGSLSLMRVSLSIPSAEQIKKIYEDEKHLFQENAKCTLYGSSDAVTALGYDEKNELLHVGTSSGRSDFQRLCRINNTTTAVTTAISAYDGSIAQQ